MKTHKHETVDRLPVDTKNLRTNGNGFLIADNVLIAREGVQIYNGFEMPPALMDELGNPEFVRVFRSLDTLSENLDSFEGIPFTDEHTFEPVTAKDRGPVCGLTSKAKRTKKGIKQSITITDANCIFDIENGNKREVSLGYLSELTVQAGDFNGDQYDVIQTSIVPNHVALTERGRCGPECAINDSLTCDCETCSTKLSKPTEDKSMDVKLTQIVIGDSVVQVEESSVAVVNGLKAQLADANTAVETVTGERDTLKTQLSDMQAKFSDEKVAEMVEAAANARAAIVAKASGYVTDSLDGLDNKAIMLKALDAAGIKDMAEKSDAHIEGAFGVLEVKTADSDKSNVGTHFAKDHGTADADADKALEEARSAYRQGK